MPKLGRRKFVSGAAAGVTALGLFGGAAREAGAQLVWKASDWNLAEFHNLASTLARIKQLCDVVQIGDGRFLNSIKNALNGLQIGFGVPKEHVKIVAALHGPANLLNFDDDVWNKHQLGSWLNVTDPATGKSAERNAFYPSKTSSGQTAADPSDLNSRFQDASIQALQSRGVQFLCCHTATVEQARVLVERHQMTVSADVVAKDMLEHTLPGVMVVASMGAAIALLQAEGHFTYISL